MLLLIHTQFFNKVQYTKYATLLTHKHITHNTLYTDTEKEYINDDLSRGRKRAGLFEALDSGLWILRYRTPAVRKYDPEELVGKYVRLGIGEA